VPVTKDLDVRIWTGVAERLKGWQSENEIADRAAADDQNAVHLSCVATALWAVFIVKSKRVCGDRPQAGGYSGNAVSILPECEGENHTAIDQGQSMQTAPAKNAPCTPVDLIAKDVRDCDPE